MEPFSITKITQDKRETVSDLVAEEIPLTLLVSDKELVTILCMSSDIPDLAMGFLFSSGLIKKAEEVKKITIDKEQWIAHIEMVNGNKCDDLLFKRLYTSGCGRGVLFYNTLDVIHKTKIASDFKIKNDCVTMLMTDFQKRSQTYLKTGGVHSAALADSEGILIFREDIGRHNAIDKVIGGAISQNTAFENKILLTSGRVSSEVLFKVKKCGLSIVISRSAPTNQGVRLSREFGITLVGFARGNRMNVYNAEERIV